MRAAHKVLRGVVVASLAAGVALGIGVGTASAETFHTSAMNTNWLAWSSPNSPGSAVYTIHRGDSVSMKCWTTGAYQDGTSKWFRVSSNVYPFPAGYVPANAVSNQWTTSPHC